MSEKTKSLIACLLIAASAVSITAGIMRKEDKTVLNKATKICMECIGIG